MQAGFLRIHCLSFRKHFISFLISGTTPLLWPNSLRHWNVKKFLFDFFSPFMIFSIRWNERKIRSSSLKHFCVMNAFRGGLSRRNSIPNGHTYLRISHEINIILLYFCGTHHHRDQREKKNNNTVVYIGILWTKNEIPQSDFFAFKEQCLTHSSHTIANVFSFFPLLT